MKNCFEEDVFSKKKISWSKKNIKDEKLIKRIKSFLKSNNFGKLIYIKKRLGLEANSQNFKVKIDTNVYLFKKWSKHLSLKKIDNIIELNRDLMKKNSLVPSIVKINKKARFHIHGNYWSFYNFIEAEHYSGSNNEFSNFSFELGKLFNELKKIKKKNKPTEDLKYYSQDDLKILLKIKKIKNKWKSIFGAKLEKKLKNNFKIIEDVYMQNSKKTKITKHIQIAHIDLHPHNILVRKRRVIAFLDLESCKQINAGYAIAFCCLKICKQTIIKNKVKDIKFVIKYIKKFKKEVSKNYPLINTFFPNFFYFATSEVLRRIMIIFSQNLKGNKTWNKVLGIQIDHLKEAKILFKN